MNRRNFVHATAAATAAQIARAEIDKPAILGGTPAKFSRPGWPMFDELEEKAVLGVLRSGKWYRSGAEQVAEFERQYAKLTGAKYCLATANGTSALLVSLNALDVGAGDEVILPPYTFVATANAILERHALPVFVDVDRETSQIDPSKIEAAITPRTKAIIPVHIGGSAANLDAILEIGKKRKIPIIEDACQAHLGEWRSRKVGTYGTTGCFSFQASKNLNCGEGGAILTNDEELFHKCSSYHNNGRDAHQQDRFQSNGLNLRMPEFQGALLTAQMTRLDKQAQMRDANAAYLSSLMKEIPGIRPARLYEGCTRSSWHIYMMLYDAKQFAGLPRATFLKALAAEGIPASGGYTPLNREPFIGKTVASRGFQLSFSAKVLQDWRERNQERSHFTGVEQLCTEAIWMMQTTLLASRENLDKIASAIRNIQRHASELVSKA